MDLGNVDLPRLTVPAKPQADIPGDQVGDVFTALLYGSLAKTVSPDEDITLMGDESVSGQNLPAQLLTLAPDADGKPNQQATRGDYDMPLDAGLAELFGIAGKAENNIVRQKLDQDATNKVANIYNEGIVKALTAQPAIFQMLEKPIELGQVKTGAAENKSMAPTITELSPQNQAIANSGTGQQDVNKADNLVVTVDFSNEIHGRESSASEPYGRISAIAAGDNKSAPQAKQLLSDTSLQQLTSKLNITAVHLTDKAHNAPIEQSESSKSMLYHENAASHLRGVLGLNDENSNGTTNKVTEAKSSQPGKELSPDSGKNTALKNAKNSNDVESGLISEKTLPGVKKESNIRDAGKIIKAVEDLNASGQVKSEVSDPSTIGTTETAKSNTLPNKMESTPVRFVLPDNIAQNKANNNRTIFIKLEPEHLGTIRLTLSSHSQGITGRLIVDSSSAQSVVESNIDKLMTQLSDKGIKLDAFHISVGGGQIGQRSSQRSSTSGIKHQIRWPGSVNRTDKIQIAGGSIPENRLYIGSSGVNWLA